MLLTSRFYANLLILFAIACTKSIDPIDPFSATPSASILMSYDLNLSQVSAKACVLYLQNKEEKTHFTVELPPGEKMLVRIPVPSGNFDIDRIQCYGGVVRPKSLFKFRVEPNSVAYIGYWKFRMEGNTIYYNFDSHKIVKKDLTAIASKQNIISGMNGKSITAQMIAETSETFNYTVNPSEAVDLKPFNLSPCLEREAVENPVQLGRMKIRAVYDSQRLQTSDISEDHTYSADLRLCVLNQLKVFRPVTKKKFTLDVTI